ncbi:MAG: hypothetical protein HOY79_40400 [Streptomyces sp.]|nr:hypothetical protein [Streptomyces sp.]
MTIDVSVARVIPLSPERLAEYAMDWRHDAWGHLPCPFRAMGRTQGIRTAELTREADGGGFGVGTEVTRTAFFLGLRIDCVLRVAVPARTRVQGGSGGCYRPAAPLLARQVRSSLHKDLRDLERRLMHRTD